MADQGYTSSGSGSGRVSGGEGSDRNSCASKLCNLKLFGVLTRILYAELSSK